MKTPLLLSGMRLARVVLAMVPRSKLWLRARADKFTCLFADGA